ncbi:histone-lysine N-methyltransferase SETMAR [Plakobranchus ocellatus]|uniref:Histone-lysine N-methyltransferase SETMAR n=1 Tax=Plakobranchus ocellatus TaxID=259542 RepID=A0AAV4APE7_9GAST|nr:histone-lysine N-methyltransferase SETMAR [Plakobranchus ocellatus]
MPDLSESGFELGDSDIHSSDTEWSSSDDDALQWAATIQSASHKRDFIVKEQTTSDFSDFKEMAKSVPNLDIDEDRKE